MVIFNCCYFSLLFLLELGLYCLGFLFVYCRWDVLVGCFVIIWVVSRVRGDLNFGFIVY